MSVETTQNAGPASNLLMQFSQGVRVGIFLWAINQIISLLGYDQKVDKDMLTWGAAKFDVLERWQQQAISSVVVVLLLCIMYFFFRWAYATINYYCCMRSGILENPLVPRHFHLQYSSTSGDVAHPSRSDCQGLSKGQIVEA